MNVYSFANWPLKGQRTSSVINTNDPVPSYMFICCEQHSDGYRNEYGVYPSITTITLSVSNPIAHNSDGYGVDPPQLPLPP